MLLLAMYQLDEGRSGPTVRIGQLRDALTRRVALDLVSGARASRGWRLLRYAGAGRLGGLDGIYVESSSSLPGPVDLLFLFVARARGIMVVTYIRDAYQLFPEYYPVTTLRRRLSRAAFLPTFRALAHVSSITAFPSRGLARAVLGDSARAAAAALLPPGTRMPEVAPFDPAARGILYVGSLALPASGGDLLVDAVQRARDRGHDVHLICVAPPGQGPREPHPPWLELVRASGSEIEQLLPRVLACIAPRPRTPYNDLAVPIKVFEYLGYRRPVITTDVVETAAIVKAAGCGPVVPATADGLAEGIEAMVTASAAQLTRWADAAAAAAAANSWGARASTILDLLGLPA